MGFTLHSRLLPGTSILIAISAVTVPVSTISSAQTPQPTVTLVEPATPLLPHQFGAWQQVADSTAVTDNAATKDVLLEDGLSRSAASSYKRDGSSETIDIKAYQFGDASGAFSAFTYFRTPEDKPVAGVSLGTSSVEKNDTVLMWNGQAVVEAEFHGGRRISDLTDLVATLPKVGGPKGYPPMLPTLLPAKDLKADSVKYALGSAGYETMGGVLPAAIVGFDKSAEVATAAYAGRGTLTLLLYPTPQIAGDHGRQIEAALNQQISAGHSFGTVKLRREGPLLALATGAWSEAEAQKIVENTHLRTELTWNKPVPLEFHAEVRKTASLLLSIAELSGALMLATVVMGLFFGGGRALIRVLQGKPAATEPEFLRIDLRERPGEGSFKPLH